MKGLRASAARKSAALVVAALAFAPLASALADEAAPVITAPREPLLVVLVARAEDPFGARLRAELESMGIDVSSVPPTEGSRRAVAVAEVLDHPRRIVVTFDASSDSNVSVSAAQPVVVEVDAREVDMQLIQAAERVRALFEPLVERAAKQPPPTQQPDTPPTLVTPPTPPPKTPTLAIVEPQPKLPPPPRVVRPAVLPPRTPSTPVVFGFSAGVALALDTAGAGLEGDAAFFVEPLGWLRFEPFIGVPLVPTRVSTDFGSADLYKGTLGARLGFRVVDTQGFDLLLGGGVAGVFLRAEGHASEGYRASTEDAFTASLLFDANASVQLTGPLWLSARGTLGLALPTPTILFANEPIMDWGLPWGTVEAALEVRFGE